MNKFILAVARVVVPASLASATLAQTPAQPAAPVTKLFQKTTGNPDLSELAVDTAPGSVSAIGLLGIAGDRVRSIDNARDLTMALLSQSDGTGFGISLTPARSALLPMSLQTYHNNRWAPALANLALAYAQNTTQFDSKSYAQRAVSIETSLFLSRDDDPLEMYWAAIENAPKDDPANPCSFPSALPSASPTSPSASAAAGPVVPALASPDDTKASNERAARCRTQAWQNIRWNASRAWLSWAAGRYSATDGSTGGRSLGQTLVAGVTLDMQHWLRTPTALTMALKRTWDEPTLATLGNPDPERHDRTLGTLRLAGGTNSWRVLAEASRTSDGTPTASERVYKRAVGADLRLAKSTWLIVRTGKQRRIDGNGDESGASVSLSISPSDLLKFE